MELDITRQKALGGIVEEGIRRRRHGVTLMSNRICLAAVRSFNRQWPKGLIIHSDAMFHIGEYEMYRDLINDWVRMRIVKVMIFKEPNERTE